MPRLISLLPILLLLAANALAAGRPLAPAPLLTSDEFTQNLSIAHAGGRFLAAWNATSVYGTLLDANGRRISPARFLIAETERAVAVEVVGTGDSFAVFWIDRDSRTHLTDVALDGRILGSRTTELPHSSLIRAAWDGEHFLAVAFGEIFRPNASRALLLERDGTIVHDIRLNVGIETAQVAVTPDGFLAFTGTADSFFAHAITHDGQATQVSAGDLPQQIASAAIDDDTILVVTSTHDGTMRSQVWTDGVKTNEQIILTQHNGGILPVQLRPGDGRHLLAFVNTRTDKLETMHLGDDGTPLSDPEPHADVVTRPFPHPAGASNGDVMVVLHKQNGFVNSLTFDGDTVTSETLSIRPASQANPLIGAGGGSMLAVWEEETPPVIRIRTAVINRDFEAENVRELAPKGELQAIAWSGTEHLVVYQSDGMLRAARVTYDGNPIGEPERIADTDPYARAAVVWAGDRWAIAWTEAGDADLRYATMSRGGAVSRPRTLMRLAGPIVSLAMAFDGSRVHLAWVEGGPFPVPEHIPGIAVATTRLRRDGRIVDATPLRIPSADPIRVGIASSNDRVVLVVDEWERSRLHALSAKTRELLSSQTLLDEYANSAVTWNGYEFFAASAASLSLSVWNLGRDGTDLDDVRTTPTLERFWPGVSIAASPSYDAITGLQELSAAHGARAVIYPSREMPRTTTNP